MPQTRHISISCSSNSQDSHLTSTTNNWSDFLDALKSKNWTTISQYTAEFMLNLNKHSSPFHQEDISSFLEPLTSYFVPLEAKNKISVILRQIYVQEFIKASAETELPFCSIFEGWFQSTKERLKSMPIVYAECCLIQEILKVNPKGSVNTSFCIDRIISTMFESSWTPNQESSQQLPFFIQQLFQKKVFLKTFENAQKELKETLNAKLEKAERKCAAAKAKQNEGFKNLESQANGPAFIWQCVKSQYEGHKASFLSKTLEQLEGSTLYTAAFSTLSQPSQPAPNLDEILDALSLIIQQNVEDDSRNTRKRKSQAAQSEEKSREASIPVASPQPNQKKAKTSETSPANGFLKMQQNPSLKAIQLNPNNSYAYSILGATLPRGEKVTLLDGTEMTQQALLLKAIQLNPNNSHAYSTLGATLPRGEKATLLDGTEMTQQALFLKAIQVDPNNSHAYRRLGASLPLGGKVTLLDGTEMTQQALFLTAIQLDPNNSLAYTALGVSLPNAGKLTLLDGTEMTQQALLLKAIQLDPNNSHAYRSLGESLPNAGKVTLLDGTEMTQHALFLKAIQLDPNNSCAYIALGRSLPNAGKVTLLDGTEMTQQALFLKAIQLDPNNSHAYHNFGIILPNGGEVTLLDGTKMTKQALLSKAIQLTRFKQKPG